VSARLLSPRAPTASLHPNDVLAEFSRRSALVAFVLDRPGVGACTHVTQHPHHPHHHDAEQRSTAQYAGRFVYEGDRRLDGDVSGVRVRSVHRVLDRQHVGSASEGQDQPRGHHQRVAVGNGRRYLANTTDCWLQCSAGARSKNSAGERKSIISQIDLLVS